MERKDKISKIQDKYRARESDFLDILRENKNLTLDHDSFSKPPPVLPTLIRTFHNGNMDMEPRVTGDNIFFWKYETPFEFKEVSPQGRTISSWTSPSVCEQTFFGVPMMNDSSRPYHHGENYINLSFEGQPLCDAYLDNGMAKHIGSLPGLEKGASVFHIGSHPYTCVKKTNRSYVSYSIQSLTSRESHFYIVSKKKSNSEFYTDPLYYKKEFFFLSQEKRHVRITHGKSGKVVAELPAGMITVANGKRYSYIFIATEDEKCYLYMLSKYL